MSIGPLVWRLVANMQVGDPPRRCGALSRVLHVQISESLHAVDSLSLGWRPDGGARVSSGPFRNRAGALPGFLSCFLAMLLAMLLARRPARRPARLPQRVRSTPITLTHTLNNSVLSPRP
jgi:hypothetical protein